MDASWSPASKSPEASAPNNLRSTSGSGGGAELCLACGGAELCLTGGGAEETPVLGGDDGSGLGGGGCDEIVELNEGSCASRRGGGAEDLDQRGGGADCNGDSGIGGGDAAVDDGTGPKLGGLGGGGIVGTFTDPTGGGSLLGVSRLRNAERSSSSASRNAGSDDAAAMAST